VRKNDAFDRNVEQRTNRSPSTFGASASSTEWKQPQADFKIENIRFTHDPHWNKRVFNLWAAHDGETWLWSGVRVVATWGVLSIQGVDSLTRSQS
jgi:hypothetical protein